MIQRIQTLYIIIAMLLVLGAAFFFPHATCEVVSGSGKSSFEENIYLFSSYGGIFWMILFSIFSLIAIFKFNDRKKQIYYINGNLIGIPFLLLILYVFHFFITESDCIIKYTNWIFDVSLVIGCFFFFLARRSIKKDEDLINSINRLR